MTASVETTCNALARTHVLKPDEARALRDRWKQSAGQNEPGGEAFLKGLVARKTLTDYQSGVLERGNTEQLVLYPDVIQDRVGKGRMAGDYRAKHRTGQTVACKVLPPSKAKDPKVLGRLQRESRLALTPGPVPSLHRGSRTCRRTSNRR
jgi:eukaryotic-like serine/threonine-protein kinase